MKPLGEQAIQSELERLPNWRLENGKIVREHRARDFRDAQQRINRICDLAEGADHHPTIHWTYASLRIALHTHDAEGLTLKDFRLAALIDQVLA